MSWKSFAGCSVAALTLLAAAPGPANYCDPNLVHESKDSTRYQMREGRCEGIYAQQVGTVSLDLRSFVQSFAAFDPEKESVMKLAWNAPKDAGSTVALRAFSLKPRTYFRMDTVQLATQGTYAWPSDVLASLRLRGGDLGVIAWTTLERDWKVYLPLRAGNAKTSTGYEATFVPSKKLSRLLFSLRQLDEHGKVIRNLFVDKDEGGEFPFYPPGTPTVFNTGKLGPAGFYRLEVKATAVTGDSVTGEIDFYHPGDGKERGA